MVNSIRPNTDRHETPQKHLFVEESCSQDIWIPSSLSILLLNYHSSIAVTCNIPWSLSQKFIYQVEGIQTRGQERIFGKESKQDVHLLKDPCNVLNYIILTAGLKNPDMQNQYIWGVLWKSQHMAKVNCEFTWALLTVLDPTNWFFLPVFGIPPGLARIRELVQQSTRLFSRGMELMYAYVFLVFGRRKDDIPLHFL